MKCLTVKIKDILKCGKAFTLAEVLITLGIIGIVAAMTIPTLMKKYEQKITITKLKKTYSLLQQAYKLSVVDNGEFHDWNLTTTSDPVEYVKTFWLPYFKGAKLCETYSDCGYTKARPWNKPSGAVSSEDVTGSVYRSAFILQDGTVISFRIPPVNQVEPSAKINIDINGEKFPNVAGKDYFFLGVNERGVFPLYADYTNEEINDLCKNPAKANACFAKIVNDGWEFKNDYPW